MINYTLKVTAQRLQIQKTFSGVKPAHAMSFRIWVVCQCNILQLDYVNRGFTVHGYLVCEAGIRKGEESENSNARGRRAPFSFRTKTCLASKWTPALRTAHSPYVHGINLGGFLLNFLLNKFYEHNEILLSASIWLVPLYQQGLLILFYLGNFF